MHLKNIEKYVKLKADERKEISLMADMDKLESKAKKKIKRKVALKERLRAYIR